MLRGGGAPHQRPVGRKATPHGSGSGGCAGERVSAPRDGAHACPHATRLRGRAPQRPCRAHPHARPPTVDWAKRHRRPAAVAPDAPADGGAATRPPAPPPRGGSLRGVAPCARARPCRGWQRTGRLAGGRAPPPPPPRRRRHHQRRRQPPPHSPPWRASPPPAAPRPSSGGRQLPARPASRSTWGVWRRFFPHGHPSPPWDARRACPRRRGWSAPSPPRARLDGRGGGGPTRGVGQGGVNRKCHLLAWHAGSAGSPWLCSPGRPSLYPRGAGFGCDAASARPMGSVFAIATLMCRCLPRPRSSAAASAAALPGTHQPPRGTNPVDTLSLPAISSTAVNHAPGARSQPTGLADRRRVPRCYR